MHMQILSLRNVQYWKNASHCNENTLKSLLALISDGSVLQSEAPKKLKDFSPLKFEKKEDHSVVKQ